MLCMSSCARRWTAWNWSVSERCAVSMSDSCSWCGAKRPVPKRFPPAGEPGWSAMSRTCDTHGGQQLAFVWYLRWAGVWLVQLRWRGRMLCHDTTHALVSQHGYALHRHRMNAQRHIGSRTTREGRVPVVSVNDVGRLGVRVGEFRAAGAPRMQRTLEERSRR